MNRLPAELSFQHHSLTFPAMSVVPKPLTEPGPPTGLVPGPRKLLPVTITLTKNVCAASVQW